MSVAFALILSVSGATEHIVAPLVPGAQALEQEGRYESPRNFEDTIDFYRRTFKRTGGIRWRNIVNLPAVKAVHLQSVRRKTQWEGINIYERQGRVRFYILPRPPKEKTDKAKK